MTELDVWLRALTAGRDRFDRVAHVERIAARAGEQAEWPQWVPLPLVDSLREAGITKPWRHQAEAAASAWSGKHTVVATAAGSGKTLALWLPALADLVAAGPPSGRVSEARRRPTALYLSPTKALGADQLVGVERMTAGSQCRQAARAAVLDGDTKVDSWRWAQASANVVLTNPDYLHYSLLPGHTRWARILSRLRWILVDEAHTYRGLFGAHVALVLRRLRRLAAHYGAEPIFTLASATVAEPQATAAALIGSAEDEIAVVDSDASPRGRRTVVLWRPRSIDADDRPTGEAEGGDENAAGGGMGPPARVSAGAEASDLLADLTLAGAQTLAFVRSRFAAESVADAARLRVGPAVASRIASYRGGYLPEERRELEARLRSGALAGLVATTALELGIDVPTLDAVVIAGWPGTRASLWQQIGRAGRGEGNGLAIWIADNNPLDSYVADHPEAIFGAPVEATVFDPTNPHALAPHLCAAAAELPLTKADHERFGPGTGAILTELGQAGVLRHRPAGWYWMPAEPASSLADLRGTTGRTVQIVEEATGRILGTCDATRAESTVHAGAVYLHQGASFVIRGLDLDTAVALAVPSRPPYRTRANVRTAVTVATERARAEEPGLAWHLGDVEVRTQVTSYTRTGSGKGAKIDTVSLDLPEHSMRTASCWLTLESPVLSQAHISAQELPGALHAAEHAAIGLLPLLATCDRWDLGGLSTPSHADTGGPVVFIHDAVPGGAGFAERAYARRAALAGATRDLLARCPCVSGCPSCVQSPKCGNANQVLDKAAAARLMAEVARPFEHHG
jgi:DEAD/DEAH box helicase domain-containing protein